MARPAILTLTTDFGYRDHYVSVLKAVILGINPDARIVDVSHEIPPQDIMAAAWVTRQSAFHFPSGTVHCVVVDPGVGTARKPVAVRIRDQVFVGPDNGLFTLVADEEPYEAFELGNTSFWGTSRSHTFHGRDIFAPVACHLSMGVPLEEMGPRVSELAVYRWARPVADHKGIQGWVVHIDRYGNLITNIPKDLLRKHRGPRKMKIYAGSAILKDMVDTYAEVPVGEPAAYIGSSGYLEVGIHNGNAETLLGVYKGAPISIVFQTP